MRIGLLQFNIAFGKKDRNFETVTHLIKNESADLWVFPELFNTGYLFTSQDEVENLSEDIPNGVTTEFLKKLSNENNCTIVAGLAEKDKNHFYNSAVVVKEGKVIGFYRKIHLFDNEKKWFAPGNLPFQVWDIGTAKIGVMICFDWIFPEATRTLALRGADIICHPSNLVLPFCQDAMVTRCIENRVFAITANRIGKEVRNGQELKFSGCSQITGCLGEIIHRAKAKEEQTFVCEIDPLLAKNKYITENNDIFNDRRIRMYE
ncbi:acyltransferase [candidate division KSB1 bacterium]|nr:acyltransferase [candidate division KSB1 bacterium]MBL7092567.1 acyltransferase [candidate division KSB1 bacterium]